MVVTASQMPALGMAIPEFNLPDTEGKTVSVGHFANAPAVLVIFLCNHCPYVNHVLNTLVEIVKQYQAKGLAVVGINSNDVVSFPEDRPEMMKQRARQAQFTFPYLFDRTQMVARAYKAACTPDFFLFDKQRRLVYRGQMDDSRPGNNIPVTGADLTDAVNAVLAGKQVTSVQKPSMGCNIKWRKANEPEYAG